MKITVCTDVPKGGCANCKFIAHCPRGHYCRLFDEDIKDLNKCEKCKQAISEERASEWISVNERLPGKYQRVLAYSPSMSESDIGPISVKWGFTCAHRNSDITHWTPLPEQPGAENQ